MRYEEVMEKVYPHHLEGEKVQLNNITAIMNELGNPQENLKIIHIAGTNGKGSTTNFMNNMLVEAGYRVGMFISPSLYEYNERIRINDENVPDEELIRLSQEIVDAIDGKGIRFTYFEWLTAMAWMYFNEQKVDFVLMETGLGGLMDATNLIKHPILTAITKIGIDHEQILGETLEEIAFQKAGIIKEGVPLVFYPQEAEITNVIKKTAEEKHAQWHEPDFSQIIEEEYNEHEQVFSYKDLKHISMQTLGVNQYKNASLAIEMIRALEESGEVQITNEQIKAGIHNSLWPGRFERVSNHPVMLVDGAHNPQGVQSLKENLERFYPGKKIIAIFGVMADKDCYHMIETIDPLVREYLLCEPPIDDRKMPNVELAKQIAEVSKKEIRLAPNMARAVQRAVQDATEDDIIVCFGSLYLIAEFRLVAFLHNETLAHLNLD